MAIKDLAITSLETITVFDTAGNYLFTLDELQNATISQGQEKVDITGKQGRKITSLKRNKTVTVSGTNGLVSTGLIEMQTGSEFEEGEGLYMWPDEISVANTAESGTAVLELLTTYAAVGDTGSEIMSLCKKNADGTLGKKYSQGFDFTYDPNTKKFTSLFVKDDDGGDTTTPIITFVEGDEYVAYYNRKITSAETLDNLSDSYSKKGQVYIDAIAEDKCSNVYHVQYYIPKADFNGEFEQTMGDDQAVHAFEIEALSGSCSDTNGFYKLTIVGEGDLK